MAAQPPRPTDRRSHRDRAHPRAVRAALLRDALANTGERAERGRPLDVFYANVLCKAIDHPVDGYIGATAPVEGRRACHESDDQRSFDGAHGGAVLKCASRFRSGTLGQ